MTKPDFDPRRAILILLFLLSSCVLLSQGKKPAQQAPKQPTYKAPVDVVVVNATVTDKKGNPVCDLAADEFRVYEDGKPQPIQTFARETPTEVSVTTPEGVGLPRKPPAGGEGAEKPGPSRPRLYSIIIDDLTTSSTDRYPLMLEAVRKFVENDIGPDDQVALMPGSARFQYPFTSDKTILLREIGDLFRLNLGTLSRSSCPTLTDQQARWIALNSSDAIPTAPGENSSVANVSNVFFLRYMDLAIRETISCKQLTGSGAERLAEGIARSAAAMQNNQLESRTRVLLQNLRQHVRSLQHFEAQKNIILFSDGFIMRDHVYDLQEVVDQALRAGTVLNTVHLRGLYTDIISASESLIDLSPDLIRAKHSNYSDDLMAQQDALNQMAHDTGGVFYHNSNDLHAGLLEIKRRQTAQYVLTYAAPSRRTDGRYHKIKVEVSRPGVEISYRQGYYSPREEVTLERRRREDVLDALRAPGDLNEIPIETSYNYYQLDELRYQVALVTTVDVRRILFLDEESRHRNVITLVVVALDEADHYVDGLVKTVEFNLTPDGYSELLNRGFGSKVDFQLPAGRYKVRTIVREGIRSKVGSLTRTIIIP